MAQSVKCLILDFGSGHILRVGETEPYIELYARNTKPSWDSLSLFPSLCPCLMSALSLSLSK